MKFGGRDYHPEFHTKKTLICGLLLSSPHRQRCSFEVLPNSRDYFAEEPIFCRYKLLLRAGLVHQLPVTAAYRPELHS